VCHRPGLPHPGTQLPRIIQEARDLGSTPDLEDLEVLKRWLAEGARIVAA
jgi:hypothetical protein